ncbi:MAG: DegT/DnrJ/EryC1/StrS family aminotransferase [Erythrobacter sp.]|uniref:DegT/DnrJ/EryC1/StrS family aminotransferase n=1 Tax=Erythrobacter sp. TaxID=1042 RepID=UPI001B0AB9C1|nr:DegT/DnrJ/EryC1/StrS family aminotransferase [Erythrobacter sp.]MBO6768987.1 DegT/DnrJ/EryC1/StrS family aminotransferase [Erythrobacter sp.]
MKDLDTVVPLVKVAMPAREKLMPALEKVLYGGFIAEGEPVYEFERQFAAKFELGEILATSSGTGALHIALLLAGAGHEKEVISTSMTAEPTNTAILQTGAIPVFADVDPDTGNLDPASVKRAINDKTAAIVVVHYAGYPADMKQLRELADASGIQLVEDCAHALGARYADQPIGTWGDSAIFSFQAIKHMTTIDGGALVLHDKSQMERARRLRWFGLSKGVARTEVNITEGGYKYNMNNVAATIGLMQLSNLDEMIQSHKQNGQFFDSAFEPVAGIKPAKILAGTEPSYWIYTLLTDCSKDVIRCLNDNGVAASKLHRPNHLHSVFACPKTSLGGVEQFYDKLVHIPCGWWVDAVARDKIAELLKKG